MTGWLTNGLTEALGLSRHANNWGNQGTQGTRALEVHLDTRTLKALGPLGIWGTRALEGHLGTQALKVLGHLASQTLGHLGTGMALGHLGTRGTRGILFSRLHINTCITIFFLSYSKLKQHQKSNSTYIKEHTRVLLGPRV